MTEPKPKYRVRVSLTWIVEVEEGELEPKVADMCEAATLAAGVTLGTVEPGATFKIVRVSRKASGDRP